ncbi:hypothetical protein PVK06_039098 [Gossypium arboreum]|uniref:SWIM-type domain-containing protein n=1 Tax=Gossypium arboreum TaxID=29729 RepID=A0ABR0N451_GOSAR|nr:hypothetical protein PVK06_039098 [Gossypium arboreum]
MLLCSVWPIYDGNKKNEVDFGLGNKHVVDLLNFSCLCIKWDLSGIPCKHALSCMQLLAISPETYVNTCCTVTTQLNIYNHLINLIKGPMQWGHVPSMIRRPLGIPKQTRRKEVDEVRKSGSKLNKTGQQANCTKCVKPGYNTRTYKGVQNLEYVSNEIFEALVMKYAYMAIFRPINVVYVTSVIWCILALWLMKSSAAIVCMDNDVALAIVTMRPASLGPIMEKLSLSPEKYGSR